MSEFSLIDGNRQPNSSVDIWEPPRCLARVLGFGRSGVLHDPDREVFGLCSGLHRQAHSWSDERFHRRGSEGGHRVARRTTGKNKSITTPSLVRAAQAL
jgi:hypothetical protein